MKTFAAGSNSDFLTEISVADGKIRIWPLDEILKLLKFAPGAYSETED